MSCDIYAKPDLTKKVRYNRKERDDEVEWEEREVNIYESADAVGRDRADVQSHEGGEHGEKRCEAVYRRPLTAVVLCVGGLCCLLLITIITLLTRSTLEKSQLQEIISAIKVNNSQMMNSYEALRTKYKKVQAEVKQLKDKIEGKCPEGWKRFGCSCYFKSTEKKTWSDSRSDCQNKGADLVVINDKEEQRFLTGLNPYGEFWIGLQATKGNWISGRQYWKWDWEWVDGSPLTETFKESGLPQYSGQQYRAATCCNQQGQWIHRYNQVSNHWICEK